MLDPYSDAKPVTSKILPLSFNHPWNEAFWIWGLGKNDLPENIIHMFTQNFGMVWHSEEKDMKTKAFLWLLQNASIAAKEKLILNVGVVKKKFPKYLVDKSEEDQKPLDESDNISEGSIDESIPSYLDIRASENES